MPSTKSARKDRASSKGKAFPKKSNNFTRLLFWFGIFLFFSGLAIGLLIFLPIFFQEVKYQTKRSISNNLKTEKTIPVDPEFGIIIPKLGINSKVIPNVNPFDANEYQRALAKGVAHAKGTSFPGQPGNVFIFSHSSSNFYNALRYNSIFYLLSKLTANDEVYLYYRGEKFKYLVSQKKIVDQKETKYFKNKGDEKTLTLMTCWPPGTNFKRLLIIAEIGQ